VDQSGSVGEEDREGAEKSREDVLESFEEISKFVKNRNARTSATTSVENDRIQIRTIV